MTAAQILLSALLLLMMLYAFAQRRRSLLISYFAAATTCCGIVFVLFPGTTSALASRLGIGRGADLILYSFILFSLIAIFNLHLHLRRIMEITTVNVRQIALLEAKIEKISK